MNLEYENLIKRKKVEKNKYIFKKEEKSDKKQKKSTNELQRVYSILEKKLEEDNNK